MNTLRSELCDTAQYFHQKGWMMGTAGNLSAKISSESFWITASAQNKGALTPQQFLRLHTNGKILERPISSLNPSAETSIHIAAYDLFPSIHACLHVHMLESNWVCDDQPKTDLITLPNLEMLKGLGWKQGSAKILVTENHTDVPQIAQDMRSFYTQNHNQFIVPGFLIRGHGITAWGNSITQARNRIELFSYIFSYMCR
jgi:methylthioribulose-1-phosphate dehydratase